MKPGALKCSKAPFVALLARGDEGLDRVTLRYRLGLAAHHRPADLLALIYFGGVATTQAIFRTLTGQQEQP